MQQLSVALAERSYPIYIGSKLYNSADLLKQHLRSSQVMVVSNKTVAPIYLSGLLDALSDYQCESVILPDGEQYKTLDTLNLIFDALLKHRFDRQCTLLALGGGVVGDMTGFAAASYQRGVNFIQIPTTLLAQVDSSVGGKTGVNHPLGKNMIGAFYQPQCVLADTETLNTLEDNQLSAGIAEVIKYGLIRDPEFFTWLEEHMDALLNREPQALSYAIRRSCENKAEVVTADELEAGNRALLNLGHTFGHAIEAGMGYGSWLHGEAVAAGMQMAADLSMRMGWLAIQSVGQIEQLLLRAKLPVRAPKQLDAQAFLRLMAVDKKVEQGKISLILLKSIGKALICKDYDHPLLLETLNRHPASALLTQAKHSPEH